MKNPEEYVMDFLINLLVKLAYKGIGKLVDKARRSIRS